VDLEDREWQSIMQMLAQQPWHLANPLLMKIGEQLRLDAAAKARSRQAQAEVRGDQEHAINDAGQGEISVGQGSERQH
jgi:hypothetical protein